jgi:hypothetical protein
MTIIFPHARSRFRAIGWHTGLATFAALTIFCALGRGYGQGTMTIGFEGPAYGGAPEPQPFGTYSIISVYDESGVRFIATYAAYTLVLVGSGVSGLPDDGTAYLGFGNTMGISVLSRAPFSLVSCDIAGFYVAQPTPLQVLGYKRDGTIVTNVFVPRPGPVQAFQTLQFNAGFTDLDRVTMSGGWAVDNLVVGIAEPSGDVMILLGAGFVVSRRCFLARKPRECVS